MQRRITNHIVHDTIFFFFPFCMEENMHDLARVPFPQGSCRITEPDLSSPWEGPRSGSCCTSPHVKTTCTTCISCYGTSLWGDSPPPPPRHCLSWWKSSGPRHKDPSPHRLGKFKCATGNTSILAKREKFLMQEKYYCELSNIKIKAR